MNPQSSIFWGTADFNQIKEQLGSGVLNWKGLDKKWEKQSPGNLEAWKIMSVGLN